MSISEKKSVQSGREREGVRAYNYRVCEIELGGVPETCTTIFTDFIGEEQET